MEWMLCRSKSKPGKSYYYNPKTKESSWKKPPGFVAEGLEPVKQDLNTPVLEETKDPLVAVKQDLDSPVVLEKVAKDSVLTPILESHVTATELELDSSGVPDDLQFSLISSVLSVRDKIEYQPSFQNFPNPPSYVNKYEHPLCIVCDTGILLSHLDIIAKYKDEPIPEAGQAVFLLPWTVLQELDQLHTHSESSVLQRVLKAVEVLRQFMESKHLRILFQSYSEMLEVRDMELPFPEANTVVRCCLYYQLKMRSGLLLLFTNDPWMSYLATNNRLHTLNGKSFLSELHPMFQQAKCAIGSQVLIEEMVEGLLSAYCNVLCGAFSAVIYKEMSEAYGDNLWSAVVLVKPPWTLSDTIAIIDKHWVAVFGLTVDRALKHACLDKLTPLVNYRLKKCLRVQWKHIEMFLFHSKELIAAFSLVHRYGSMLDKSLMYLDELAFKIKKAKPDSSVLTQRKLHSKQLLQANLPVPPPSQLANPAVAKLPTPPPQSNAALKKGPGLMLAPHASPKKPEMLPSPLNSPGIMLPSLAMNPGVLPSPLESPGPLKNPGMLVSAHGGQNTNSGLVSAPPKSTAVLKHAGMAPTPPQAMKLSVKEKIRAASSEEEIKKLAQDVPSNSAEVLPWLLGVVGRSVELCVSLVKANLTTSPAAAEALADNFVEKLEKIIHTTRYLTANKPTISSLRDFVVAVNLFLETSIKIDRPIISVDPLFQVLTQHQQMLLIESALQEFTANCKLLQHLVI